MRGSAPTRASVAMRSISGRKVAKSAGDRVDATNARLKERQGRKGKQEDRSRKGRNGKEEPQGNGTEERETEKQKTGTKQRA